MVNAGLGTLSDHFPLAEPRRPGEWGGWDSGVGWGAGCLTWWVPTGDMLGCCAGTLSWLIPTFSSPGPRSSAHIIKDSDNQFTKQLHVHCLLNFHNDHTYLREAESTLF